MIYFPEIYLWCSTSAGVYDKCFCNLYLAQIICLQLEGVLIIIIIIYFLYERYKYHLIVCYFYTFLLYPCLNL